MIGLYLISKLYVKQKFLRICEPCLHVKYFSNPSYIVFYDIKIDFKVFIEFLLP